MISKQLLELTKNKVVRYKINIQNNVCFYTLATNYLKEKLRKAIPFAVAYKIILRNKFKPRRLKTCTLKKYKAIDERLKKTRTKWKDMSCSRTGRINTVKCPYYVK